MAEPENQTLQILREFRREFSGFRAEFDSFRTETRQRFEDLTRAFAGESVLGRYAVAEVEDRLSSVEKRVSELELRR